MLRDHLVLATVYSRASLPTDSFAVPAKAAPAAEDGFWALRIVRKDGAPAAADVLDEVAVSLRLAKAEAGAPKRAL